MVMSDRRPMASKLIAAIALLCLIAFMFMCLTAIGEKTMVGETITLPPGGEKTYYLPPGMVNVEIVRTDTPVDESENSLFGGGRSNGTTRGKTGIDSPWITRFTIVNPGKNVTSVSLRITTGFLNPFGYVW